MKTMTFDEFQKKWANMPEHQNSYLSLGDIHPLNLQIGHGSNNYKSFIIMDSGEVRDVPSSFAIQAANPKLANGKRALEFQLVYNSFEEEFQRLCWDMIEVTAESPRPLNDMIARYMSWQRLLQYYKQGKMSFERQKGLLGELLFLRELIQRSNPRNAVMSWCGPDGSDQDFLFETTWVEVKTVSLASSSVKISSLEQLEQESKGILVIYILEKTTPGEQRVFLPKVVADIRNLLIDDALALDKFNMRLFKYGYRDKDEDDYRQNVFRLIEKRSYDVTDEFPKLTKKNVPVELTACKYELSLPSLEVYRRK